MRLPREVRTGVRTLGRARTGAPGAAASAAVAASNEFARTMGVIGDQLTEIERIESEAQYAEAITKFERDDIAIRQDLQKSRKYTVQQLDQWGIEVNPTWRVDPATGEVEASETMSEIYDQRINAVYNEAFGGITAPSAKGQFSRQIPRVVERIKNDIAAQQQRMYLDVLSARHMSAAAQHLENGNALLAISSYEAARDAGALSAEDAQKLIDAAPAQAEGHTWGRVLRGQNATEMNAAAEALRSDDYSGELSEDDRHRFARTLEANAEAIESEARKERYQAEVEQLLQADPAQLQSLIMRYKATGASDRLGLDPTQVAALHQNAEGRLAIADRRQRDRVEAAALELHHDEIIALSRGEGIGPETLDLIDARYESGIYGAPGSPVAMRVHKSLNQAVLSGLVSQRRGLELASDASRYMEAGVAIPHNDKRRNDIAQLQWESMVENGASANDAIVKVSATSAALPSVTQDMFKSVAFSPGHPQVENAAALFQRIRSEGGANALQSGLTDDEFDRMAFLSQNVSVGLPVSNAFDTLERINAMDDKERADAQAAWRAKQKDDETSFDHFIDEQLDPGWFATAPELGDRARAAAKARAEQVYMAYGDANFANAQALDWFNKRYGISTVNGVEEFTFNGPENVYGRNADGTPVLSGEEARRQLVEDLKVEGYTRDSLIRVEPSDVLGEDGKPVYAVWVQNPKTGIVELMERSWQPDPARRIEELQKRRDYEMALEANQEAIDRYRDRVAD